MAKLAIMKGTFERNVSPDTPIDKGQLLAQKCVELQLLEAEKSATCSGYNEQIKQLKTTIQQLAEEIKSGQINVFDKPEE